MHVPWDFLHQSGSQYPDFGQVSTFLSCGVPALFFQKHSGVEEAFKARQLQAEKELKNSAAKEQKIRNRLLDSQHECKETKAEVSRLKAQMAQLAQLNASQLQGMESAEILTTRMRDMEVSHQATVEDLQRAVSQAETEGKYLESHNQVLKSEAEQADARETEYETRLHKQNHAITTHETLGGVQGKEIEKLGTQIRQGAKREDKLQRLVHEKEQHVAEALSLQRNLEAALHLKEQDLVISNRNSLAAKQTHLEAMEKALVEAKRSEKAALKAMVEKIKETYFP